MEFPHLGSNCSWPLCKDLDFLPISCPQCKLNFCKLHITLDSHKCKETELKNVNKMRTQGFACDDADCKQRTAVEMICQTCQKNFCLLHRHHSCFENTTEIAEKKATSNTSKEHFAQSLKKVNQIVKEGINKSMQNPKKKKAAQQLNLMCLKGKSKGPSDIPPSNRVYFSIIFTKDNENKKCLPLFTSNRWSVGRVIDSFSEICSLSNRNNEMNAKKLRLFKKCNGFQISNNMSENIGDLINQNKVVNGETLILEYVSPSEDLSNFILKNVDDYSEE